MLYKESDIDRSNKNFAVTIKEYIDENYSDRRISMNVLIGLVGYSDVRINSVFKQHYGMTPIEYLQKLRIEKVKELIEIGVPLGMAAYKAGYGSQRTFYRSFAKHTGMSPGEFKESVFRDYDTAKDMVKNHDMSPIEYARRICDTMMFESDPSKLPPCFVDLPQSNYSYVQGMALLGMFNIYKWCGDERYLNYIGEWINTVIQEDGLVVETYEHPRYETQTWLDSYQPLRLLMEFYTETGSERSKTAVEHFIGMLKNFRRNKQHAYVHRQSEDENTVFINSVYMLCPTLCMYAKLNDKPSFYESAVNQPIVIDTYMRNEQTGLLSHAWDETMRADWADPETGLSEVVWGRGMGYYIMGILDMLEYLPKKHRKRKILEQIAKDALIAIMPYQDKTGRWYQLLEKNTLEGNWLETSCSCMFAYSFAKAINQGILGKEYARVAMRAYSAIIDTVIYDENGRDLYLSDICAGISAGATDAYLSAGRSKNDLHGMGAFIQMCCEIEKLLENL